MIDLAIRLFNLLIELDYFEKEIRRLLQENNNLVDVFVDDSSDNSLVLVPQKIAEYITKTKKVR